MSLSCLEQLLAPCTSMEFLSTHWPQSHHLAHGPLKRLPDFAELPELGDLQQLLTTYRDEVVVALADKRDEHSTVSVDAGEAHAMYRSGMALIFDSAERFIPVLGRWLHTLALELGLPPGCVARTILYATPPGAGNSPHFDANANFVVQLKGTKRWTIAPNTQLPLPTDRWAMNMGPPTGELAGYLDRELPTQMPQEGSEVIALHPGSVLFLPRGYWHSTETEEECLSLNFTYSQPTWADVVTAALRRELLKDPKWRELADGLGARDPLARSVACTRLAQMIHQLPAAVFELEARRILDQISP